MYSKQNGRQRGGLSEIRLDVVIKQMVIHSPTCRPIPERNISDLFHKLGRLAVQTMQSVHFDIDTVLLLRKTLDEAWVSLRPAQRATTSRSVRS